MSREVKIIEPTDVHHKSLPSLKHRHPEFSTLVVVVITGEKNSFSFKDKNQGEKHYPLLYNRKKNICLKDPDCHDHLPEILQSMSVTLPKDAIIWVPIDIAREDFVKVANTFVTNGFENPYINTISPHSLNIPPSLCLSMKNKGLPKKGTLKGEESTRGEEGAPGEIGQSNPNMTLNKVYDVLQQYKNNEGVCFVNVQLTKEAVDFLKGTCFSGFQKAKNGKRSQKELTGELYVKNVIPKGGKFIYIIDINLHSVKAGKNESVDVEPHRYNFHSHPKEAYERHDVDKAWPSVIDYLGYLQLGKNTIFHCVASIEGMYVLSFTPHWSQRLDQVDKKLTKFVDKNFEIDHEESYTPKEYTELINNIKYKPKGEKEGHPIFHVDFFTWKKAGNVFSVFFPQIGSSCLVSQKIVNNYRRVHH
jgi:hypothetical protein